MIRAPYTPGRDSAEGFSASALPPYIALVVLGFLMAAYTAGYAWSTPSADTADELLRAYEIRHAVAYPLEGPFLGGALHLGPVWWYLTALPLWLSHRWLAVALFIGFVCSLKFPLAYFCGRRLLDPVFGLLWAAAMFVPGWPSLEPLVFLNPNAVAAAALLVLLVALRSVDPEREWPAFAALGLCLAVAIHVHPTAAPVFLLLAPVLWTRYRRRSGLAAPLVALAAGFIAPFLPYVVSEVRGGFGDWRTASAYLHAQVVPGNIVSVPSVIADYVYAGPEVLAEYLLHWRPAAASALGAAMVAAACTAPAAFLHAPSRKPLLLFAGALLVFAAWIACARPTTPFQFTWMLCPLVASLVAIGLWSLARYAMLRTWVWIAVAAAVALNLSMLRAMAVTVEEGEGHLPSRVMDIKNRIPQIVFRDVWFPAFAHDRLGRFLCDAGEGALHGHLAYIADKDLGLDTLFACRQRLGFSLAASSAPRHYAAMTRRFWETAKGEPDCWVGSLGLTRRMMPLLNRAPIPLADGSTYMPRPLNRNAPQKAVLSFDAPGSGALLVTNVLDGYEPFRIVFAEAAGQAVSPIAENDLSALYAAHGSAGVVRWTLTVMATNPGAIDVVAMDLAGPPAGVCRSGRSSRQVSDRQPGDRSTEGGARYARART